MTDELSANERKELDRRRETEVIIKSVEASLKWRYTWIGIIVAVVAFFGGTAYIRGITGSLEVQIALAERTLSKIIVQAEKADNLSEQTQTKLDGLDETVDSRLDALDKQIQEKTDALEELFEARRRSTENLDRTVAGLGGLEKRVEELSAIVESMVTDWQPGNQPSSLTKVASDLSALRTEQKTLAQSINRTAQQIQLSQYSVYVHYAGSDPADRAQSEKLSLFLSEHGFVIPDIRNVDPESRSIRYFFDSDRPGAIALLKQVEAFLGNQGMKGIEIDVRDFTAYSGKKPRQGVIELWLYY